MQFAFLTSLLAGAGLAAAAAGPAVAHVTIEQTQAKVGSNYKAVFRVPHGCDGSATLKLRVLIPEGVIGVKPQPKAGWELTITRGKYEKPHDFYGTAVSEGVRELAWTGRLPDEYYDEFVFRGMIAKDLTPGSTLAFPVVQECEKGVERWIDRPPAGKTSEDVASPAPAVKLLPAE